MLNLEELEKKLNEVLETETPLSLMAWLEMKKREESNNDWISVKERLPENNKDLLGYHGNRKSIWLVMLIKEPHTNALRWLIDEGFEFDFDEITHWQPLPEPPKGE